MNKELKQVIKLYKFKGNSLYGKIYPYLRSLIFPAQEIENHIPKDASIIDIGCGYGFLANYLSLKSSKRHVLGVDLNSRRIDVANKTIGVRKNIKFENKDATKLDISAFDVVIMTDFLHHLLYNDQEDILKKLKYKISRNGIIIIEDVTEKPRIKYLLSIIIEYLLYPFSEKANFRKIDEMKSLIESSGLELVSFEQPKKRIFAFGIYVCKIKGS